MKLTQRDLAALAKVSTPTVSRFEQAAKDLQLSSALAILDVLGMTDKRTLIFPDKQYSYDTGAGVTFWGQDGAERVRCRIAREALDDHFSDGDRLRPAAAFEKHRGEIEALTRRKYLRGQLEQDKSVLIRTNEIA
jgi:transcriptional regulator with XRE-family HTH domain